MTCHFGWQVQPILATKNSIMGRLFLHVTVMRVENKALI
jgi:hypothetical protein